MVERLLLLPMDYWSQMMMVEQENIDPAHVIENTNAYSTPQTPDVKGNPRVQLLCEEQRPIKAACEGAGSSHSCVLCGAREGRAVCQQMPDLSGISD